MEKQETANTMDLRTYIEHVYGNYSEEKDEKGDYNKYKKYYDRLQKGENPFNIWAMLFYTGWFAYRRMYLKCFIASNIIVLHSAHNLVISSKLLNLGLDVAGLAVFIWYFGFRSISSHWKFIHTPRSEPLKKGHSLLMAILMPILCAIPAMILLAALGAYTAAQLVPVE